MSSGGHSGRLSILQAAAIDDVRMGASALRMLVTLGTYADAETGWCRVKVRTVADRLGVSRQAASKALGLLGEYGYVEIQLEHDPRTGSQVASSYRLIMDFVLPDQFRRTPQPDIAGGANLTLRPPQPEIADPATPEVAAPVNPSLTPPATPEVAPIERPYLTTQINDPPVVVPPAAVTAAASADQAKILRSLSAEAREILDWHRECHGRRSPAKLTPESARVLEAAVVDLGVPRLREAVKYMAGKIPPVPELSKALSAARTKRRCDENPGSAPRRNGTAAMAPPPKTGAPSAPVKMKVY